MYTDQVSTILMIYNHGFHSLDKVTVQILLEIQLFSLLTLRKARDEKELSLPRLVLVTVYHLHFQHIINKDADVPLATGSSPNPK